MKIWRNKNGESNAVMVISMALVAVIGIWGVVAPASMTGAAQSLVSSSLKTLDWYFLAVCSSSVILMAYMAFSKYGDIKLGRDDEVPEFSTMSWVAMLFAGGMGAGLIFWGVAEPIYHFVSPPGMIGRTALSARQAFVITNLHWGFHAWSLYGTCALVIAYFTFRLDLPSLISSPIKVGFNNLFSKSLLNKFGVTADVLAVLSVIFGMAGSVAMGVFMVRSGLTAVFGTSGSTTVAMLIMAAMFVCYMLSACTGVDKGIKILSNLNMGVAIAILLVVLFGGPTTYLFQVFLNSLGDYLYQILPLSFRIFSFDSDLTSWTHDWTLTYFIWWLAWGPFVGIFIARISRGRTIRQFVTGVIIIPSVFSMLWFAAFGGAALHIELFGGGGLADAVFADVTNALFVFFSYFPATGLLNALAVFLTFVFLVTSADSGTYVLAMMTSNGSLNPSLKSKMFWGIMIAVLTISVIVSGSIPVAKAMAITGAIPFVLIVIMQVVGFLRVIRTDPKILERLPKPTSASVLKTNKAAT